MGKKSSPGQGRETGRANKQAKFLVPKEEGGLPGRGENRKTGEENLPVGGE